METILISKKFTLGVLFGTRPEAIKVARLIDYYKNSAHFEIVAISTGQHQEMMRPILDFFSIKEDINLNIMKPGQTVFDVVVATMEGLGKQSKGLKLDGLFVQGDTASCMAGSIWGFLNKIPVFHIEAGLRSGNIYQPWPEEYNRRVTGQAASIHFAPTQGAAQNLINEGFNKDSIYVVGNTVIDSLKYVTDQLKSNPLLADYPEKKIINQWKSENKKLILLTVHRRESIGDEMRQIFKAIRFLSEQPDVKIILPLHLNPAVQEAAKEVLAGSQVLITPPLSYVPFIDVMSKCRFVLSDSGGVQEEAPSLGKPVLVLRKTTERPEGVAAGTCELVGSDEKLIINKSLELLNNDQVLATKAKIQNPYGDGTSCLQIANIVEKFLSTKL